MINDIKEILFTEEQIKEKCKELAKQVDKVYQEEESIYTLGLLKGSIPFMAELVKHIKTPLTMNYMQVSSYVGDTSTELIIKKDIEDDITGKAVLIIEDILDTGKTLTKVTELLQKKGAKSVKVITLLDKVEGRTVPFQADFAGFICPNQFVVGFGLDYNECYRQMPFIGILKEECYI